uniref:Transcription elongation factor Eaf N-terminal domain-containing protein n=1 Tax=Opuntia streptacantha TaxID=393608 RepID=A0A7C9DVE2_OPUST
MSVQNKDEPSTAPNPDRWYTLTLGSSFKEHQPSSKFCTLRYEFKPASIDKSQPGSLHKTKDNKISVEFQNNQPGKPKVTFEGTSEDYKENDAVLFFDGHTFRLERLHRAVKRLRHVRLPGESAAAASLGGASAADAGSPPVGRGVKGPAQNLNARPAFTQPLPPPPPPPPPSVPVEVERINVERVDIRDAGSSGGKPRNEEPASTPPAQPTAAGSPDSNDFDLETQLNIMNDEDEENPFEPDKSDIAEEKPFRAGIDINLPHNDTDDEIADVDINDDNGGIGHNAAEALRAQVNAEEREEQSSSESESSESESSESSSGESSSSSGDSESSDGDSVNSI